MWNLLRHMRGIVAYYEPCHDSLLEHLAANTGADPSHVGVDNYWQEYLPIRDTLARHYRQEFSTQRLCLPEHGEYPELRSYLQFLLDSAPEGHVSAMKLNRMDLRLPWLSSQFPDIPILYIRRNPRDQWVSMLRGQNTADVDDPRMNSGYDLIVWSANLAPNVPRLGSKSISSSYERHYLIWRICCELAEQYADIIVDFDQDLQLDPDSGIAKVLGILGADPGIARELRPLLVARTGGAWHEHHDEAWFAEVESRCDTYLQYEGMLDKVRSKTLFNDVPEVVAGGWQGVLDGLIYPLCGEISRCRSVTAENVAAMKESLAHAHANIHGLKEEIDKRGQYAAFARRGGVRSEALCLFNGAGAGKGHAGRENRDRGS